MTAHLSPDTRRRIARHVATLGDEDQERAHRAEVRLMRFGVKAVEQLLAVVDHPEPRVRYRAVWALGKIGDPRAYDALVSRIVDEDEEVRYDAILALGELGDARAEPLLARLAAEASEDSSDQAATVDALGRLENRTRKIV